MFTARKIAKIKRPSEWRKSNRFEAKKKIFQHVFAIRFGGSQQPKAHLYNKAAIITHHMYT